MAITHKQAIMMLHQEGTATSTLAPQTSLFVVLKQLHPVGGGQDQQALLKNKEANLVEKSNFGSSLASINKISSISLSAMANTDTSNQLCNLPAEITSRGVTVTLDNNNMWNEFFRCQTEMILTKQGRRMFPYCRFRISGLEPFQRYTFAMDMQPVDNHRYKWSDRRWETNGKAEPHIPRLFVHPDSPATGFDWMQNPVSFYKLKLTNNPLDRESHIVINSMHRYLPRLHIIPADKAVDDVKLNDPDVITFSFPQTEFFAVTAYQNLSITQLKIDYNPFAKGFREDACNSRCSKPKTGCSSEKLESEVKFSKETTTLNNLKSLFAKKNAAGKLPFNKDNKSVHCDRPMTTEQEKSSSDKKRPWPDGLSDLIKNVKVKRISHEKTGDSDHQTSICLSAEDKNIDGAAEDYRSNTISILADAKEAETDKKMMDLTDDVKNINDGPVIADTSSFLQPQISSTTETSSSTDMQCSFADQTATNAAINEKVETTVSEATALPDEKLKSIETSQTVVNCEGEVKKKRAEPVPLPLLALFLQQLKSKTRSTRPKAKSEPSRSQSQPDASCNTTSVDVNSSASTETFAHTFETQSNKQLETSLSITTKPETVLGLDSGINTVAFSKTDVLDAMQVSTPDKGCVTTSGVVLNSTPTTFLSSSKPDTNIVSTVFPKAAANLAPSCAPEALTATASDVPPSENVHSNITTSELSTEVAVDPCTVSFSELAPVSVQQSFVNNTQASPLRAASSRDASPPSSAPSSPDPFPPGLFSERPIPPRKSLDPFPPCSCSFKRTRPLMLSSDPSLQNFDYDPILSGELGRTTGDCSVSSEVTCSVISSEPCNANVIRPCISARPDTKSTMKRKKGGKSKQSQDAEVTEDRLPVTAVGSSEGSDFVSEEVTAPVISSDSCIPEVIRQPLMSQPSLEDVEGQLFVSFTSKKALEIHLGDEAMEHVSGGEAENIDGEVSYGITERIYALEKMLLRDLKIMKHRQVIHPVLQEVGLKLNLLDLTLAIDLQYLGVCLPIPPPNILPGESAGSCSSQVPYVSRTGKTSDFTKIKGWRDKFATTSSSSFPAVSTSSDAGQKNLSAFCSDMLDEYLESEGKLIDERASSFSQATVTPVAYEMPTKSTSYVRTLDSVLKNRPPSASAASFKPFEVQKKATLKTKSKEVVVSREKLKKSFKSKKSAAEPYSQSATNVEGSSSKKSIKSVLSESVPSESSAAVIMTEGKKSLKVKTKKSSKTLQSPVPSTVNPSEDRMTVSPVIKDSNSGTTSSSQTGGRSSGLPKTLVKLLDVEDAAVWEGKHRTCITEERAAIALSCLITTEGTVGGSPSTIIKRRAPPCLNDFCRLGCVCASLVQERRQSHCGKSQCMLGCNCLRRKVVLLKNPEECKQKECTKEEPALEGHTEENGTKGKKKKRHMSFVLFGSEAAPEPATRVTTLWNQNNDSVDSEQLFIPTPARHRPHLSAHSKQALEARSSKSIDKEGLSIVKDRKSCARVRPFYWKTVLPAKEGFMREGGPDLGSHGLLQETEEGELLPPTQPGPTRRLEIVSKCKWGSEGSRNAVLRSVCERMAQDILFHPFRVGNFQIEPISRTVTEETDEEPLITYKVVISQLDQVEDEEQTRDEKIKQLETQLIETIGKSEVKGLPLLSQVTPAGLLKAEKKLPGALGQIMVNGKLYPQGKLELGHMGALHPANRLAAYITGRVCLNNKPGTQAVTTATVTQTTTSVPTITNTSVDTTTVTTTCSSTPYVKPVEGKPPMGPDFAQVVINHISSMQPKLPDRNVPLLQSTSNKTDSPSSSPGLTDIPNVPPKASMAPQPKAPLVTKVIKVISKSGSDKAEGTFMIRTTRTGAVLPGGGIRLTQPLILTRPPLPNQKTVVYRSANGNLMCRNSAGQLVRLVPLSQFKLLNPSTAVSQQSTVMRLPTPNTVTPSKPQTDGTTFTRVTPVTPTSSITLHKNVTHVHSTTTHTATTTTAPTMAAKPIVPFSGSKCLLLSSQTGRVKLVPGFVSNTGTTNIRIVPNSTGEPKVVRDPRIVKTSTVSGQKISETPPADQGFIQLTPQCQDQKVDVQISSAPAKVPTDQDVKDSQCPKPSDGVIFGDHSYTFETKKSADEPESGSDPRHTLQEEVPDLGLVEVVVESCTQSVVADVKHDGGSQPGSYQEEVDLNSDCTELTEDSDLCDDTDSAHSSVITDSYGKEKKEKRDSVEAKLQDSTEEEDEMVDVETFEERTEKSTASLRRYHDDSETSTDENEHTNYVRCQRKRLEQKRRIALKDCFNRLQQTLHCEDDKVSKSKLLKLALKEIHCLTNQRDHLMKTQNELKQKKASYLKIASQLSGKTMESISEKLDAIVSKQKSLTQCKQKNKETDTSLSTSMPRVPTTVENRMDKDPLHSQDHLSPSMPSDLSLNKQKSVISSTKPNEAALTSHQLTKCPPPERRERTRPNILSRSKSKNPEEEKKVFGPQVIPLLGTIVPYNHIITIHNPVQPTDVGHQPSAAPGVAVVSLSVPISGESPLPILQPQGPKLTDSPLNIATTENTINLPKISSVVSLVLEENLLIPPPVDLQKTDVPTVIQTAGNSAPEEAQQKSCSQGVPFVEEEVQVYKQPPEVVATKSEQGAKTNTAGASASQKEAEVKTAKSEQADENLMTLLDELVFLNQQLNDETTEPEEEASDEREVLTDILTEKDMNRDDDERSLSPLFLKLDEDLTTSPTSNEETEDSPSKVDDLVKAIFGSDSPSNSSEPGAVSAASVDVPACHINPSPPPLLNMKAGGASTADSKKEQTNISWRPMPKLAPLGLKIQDSGQPKSSSPVLKPD